MHFQDIVVQIMQYTKSYNELKNLKTFEERLNYLMLNGNVGDLTFGGSRYLNQSFYKSKEWLDFRMYIIERDCACDLGIEGHEIYLMKSILVHHINPITIEDLINKDPSILDENNAIATIHRTHNLIHYGFKSGFNSLEPIERKQYDTIPWR